MLLKGKMIFFVSIVDTFVFAFVFHLTCDLICSLAWIRRKWEFHTVRFGGVENSTALLSNLTTAQCLIKAINWAIVRERKRREGDRVCPCVRLRVRQSRTDKHSRPHSASFLNSSGERVGRISKRTLNCPEGEIKEQQEHTNPCWTTVSFPDLCCGLSRVGKRGWFWFWC